MPDVAASASPASGWLVRDSGGWSNVGGTSAASPFWAASMLLAEQYARSQGVTRRCFLAPILYTLASTQQPYPPFHDVALGGNRYYDAKKGWDYATGLGSPDVWNLARDLTAYLRTHPRPRLVSTVASQTMIAPTTAKAAQKSSRPRFAPTNAIHGVLSLRPDCIARSDARSRERPVDGRSHQAGCRHGRAERPELVEQLAVDLAGCDDDDLVGREALECIGDGLHRIRVARLAAADLRMAREQPLRLERAHVRRILGAALVRREPVERAHLRRHDDVDRRVALAPLLDRSLELGARRAVEQQDEQVPAHCREASGGYRIMRPASSGGQPRSTSSIASWRSTSIRAAMRRRQLELEAAPAELFEAPDEDAQQLLGVGALRCGDEVGHRASGLVIGSRCPGTTPSADRSNRRRTPRASGAARAGSGAPPGRAARRTPSRPP